MGRRWPLLCPGPGAYPGKQRPRLVQGRGAGLAWAAGGSSSADSTEALVELRPRWSAPPSPRGSFLWAERVGFVENLRGHPQEGMKLSTVRKNYTLLNNSFS